LAKRAVKGKTGIYLLGRVSEACKTGSRREEEKAGKKTTNFLSQTLRGGIKNRVIHWGNNEKTEE